MNRQQISWFMELMLMPGNVGTQVRIIVFESLKNHN